MPHWSETITWRPGRWDPMCNAPRSGPVDVLIRVRNESGQLFEPVHYACGDGDGLMPPFDGWFCRHTDGSGFYEVAAYEWQPLTAEPNEPKEKTWPFPISIR